MLINDVTTNEQRHFTENLSDRFHCRVLVVDDNEGVRNLLGKALAYIGCDVVEAGNGKEGFELFLNHGADLVVTDLDMPVMDGYGLIQRLEGRSPQTPIVIITGQAPDNVSALLNANIRAILYKPFPIKKLQDITRAAVLEHHAAFQ
jgi:CheY-like chemotaxis protein